MRSHADGADASFLLAAGAEHKVMIVPGYLTSAQHLQALAAQHYHTTGLGQAHGAKRQPSQAAEAAAAAAAAAGVQPPPPCPFFRVSFASVSVEQLDEGFARLRRAILSHRQAQQQQ
jgi:hypothetical protein